MCLVTKGEIEVFVEYGYSGLKSIHKYRKDDYFGHFEVLTQ